MARAMAAGCSDAGMNSATIPNAAPACKKRRLAGNPPANPLLSPVSLLACSSIPKRSAARATVRRVRPRSCLAPCLQTASADISVRDSRSSCVASCAFSSARVAVRIGSMPCRVRRNSRSERVRPPIRLFAWRSRRCCYLLRALVA